MGSCPEFFGVHQGPLTSFADCPRGRDRASWPEVTFHMGAVATCPCCGLRGRVCAGVGVSGTTHPGHPWGRVPCVPSPERLSGIPPGVRQHRPLPSSPCPFLLPRAEAIGTCSSHGTADVGDVPCLPGGDTRDRWCGNAGRNYRGWRQGGRAWSGGRAGSVSPCPKALSLPRPALGMCRCPQMNARLCGIQLAPKHPNKTGPAARIAGPGQPPAQLACLRERGGYLYREARGCHGVTDPRAAAASQPFIAAAQPGWGSALPPG